MNSNKRPLLYAAVLAAFVPLSTANSAGYRYGASDLAFYGPAVMQALEPDLFPRDRPLIEAQARLTLMDESVAALARVTTTDLPTLFLLLYIGTLILLATAGAAIATGLYRSPWTGAALLAALTLDHAIARSGTNTLEPYFHPRQLAFALGVLAVAAFLRGKLPAVLAAIGGAALLHPTTALWFAIWLGVAGLMEEPQWRRAFAALGAAAAVAAAWAFAAGPLAGRLVFMDREWLAAIATKDYLFPFGWPPEAWVLNLSYLPIVWLVYRRRRAAGLLRPRERGIVLGALALSAVFLVAAALTVTRLALAVQLQTARVFWMLDFLAVVYAVWALAEAGGAPVRRARLVALVLLTISAARGAYVMLIEFPERPLFEVRVPGDWGRVSEWAQRTPRDSHWLADPAHAARYGTSLRMAARRDVLVEATKDTAIGMYDRAVALRTRDRLRDVGDFTALTAADTRRLAARYNLDYVVTEQELALPLAYRAGAMRVYELK